jgi:hypothetical protein
MDLSKPAPQPLPQSYKGHLATAVLHPDRVEFRRRWIARLGGNRSSTVLLADVLKVWQVPPTRMVNGHVHLMTAADPGALRNLTMETGQQPAGNPRAILFAWGQRETQAVFVAAVEAALQGLRPGL